MSYSLRMAMKQKSDDIVLIEGNNELNVQMTPLPELPIEFIYLSVNRETVRQGEELIISGAIYLPATLRLTYYALGFWYWDKRVRGSKSFGYEGATPEGGYDFGIVVPSYYRKKIDPVHWVNIYVPLGTYPIYTSLNLIDSRGESDIVYPVFTDIDTGFRITVV